MDSPCALGAQSLAVQVSNETPDGTGVFEHADVEDASTVFNTSVEDLLAVQRGGECLLRSRNDQCGYEQRGEDEPFHGGLLWWEEIERWVVVKCPIRQDCTGECCIEYDEGPAPSC